MIYGELAKERQIPPATKVSWVKKLLGHDSPQTLATSGPVKEVSADDLGKALRRSFRDFLERRIEKPWSATRGVLAYLDLGHATYVRAERSSEAQSPGWYVQFMFSGCSGMGEVSAELAVHWASIWFADQQVEIIRDHLAPFGFEPNSETDDWVKDLRFLPLGEFGYAKILSSHENAATNPDFRRFEVDCAFAEELSEADLERFFAELESLCGDELSGGRCRCQVCSPEFDAAKVTSLLERFTH